MPNLPAGEAADGLPAASLNRAEIQASSSAAVRLNSLSTSAA